MVNFLIHRPVSVNVTYFALTIMGLVSVFSLPVSLMPDMDIPVISVRVNAGDMPARQLEDIVVMPVRNMLKEVGSVDKMTSETRDGMATIELRFRHGTPVHLASVEVNEKVDKVMNFLPSGIQRPEVIRVNASDIPVFYLMVHSGKDALISSAESGEVQENTLHDNPENLKRLEISNFTNEVIRKRLEQLPEVAMIDISGLHYPEIKIIPHDFLLESGVLTISRLEEILLENHVDLGNLQIKNGQYQYSIRFNSQLGNISEIRAIATNLNGKVVRLGDLAEITLQTRERYGNVRYNGQDAISLAVIKQPDARMGDLKKQLGFLVSRLREDYPELDFTITRDQSRLLSYSMDNLFQSLYLGALLAFLTMFLFLREYKAPLLIGISIPVSLVISLLLFYLAGLSINIISLSGLILGVGMMIDNSIIVIDNITQHRERKPGTDNPKFRTSNPMPGDPEIQRSGHLANSCVRGTGEIIRPLISSVLTTCAVFVPLVFLKGMAGTLFFDQAVAVSVGLTVSLIVSITLLPVLYRMLYKNHIPVSVKKTAPGYYNYYEKGLKMVLRHPLPFLIITFFLPVAACFLYKELPLTKFPKTSADESVLKIDWNEPVTLQENNLRIYNMFGNTGIKPEYVVEEAGRQQYLIQSGTSAGSSENRVFIKTSSPSALKKLVAELTCFLEKNYPECDFFFEETDHLFNLSFGKTGAALEVQFVHFHPGENDYPGNLRKIQNNMESLFPGKIRSKLAVREIILLETDPEKLSYYSIDYENLNREIKSAFQVNTVFSVHEHAIYIPVTIGKKYSSISQIIQKTQVSNLYGEKIPLSGLIKTSYGLDLRNITAGKEGEYFPVFLDIGVHEYSKVTGIINDFFGSDSRFNLSFGGEIPENAKMLKELLIIVFISFLLLYFILAAQFESLILPCIVLLEVPVDLFGAFLFLRIFNQGINIMSAIGIIVMSGIIINDSILKIDTINKLNSCGYSLLKSIMEAGRRRLKPILMTSLTTILAIIPIFFQTGMAAELQYPLALTIMGGMTVGTLVSLFIIPLLCFLIKKRANKNA